MGDYYDDYYDDYYSNYDSDDDDHYENDEYDDDFYDYDDSLNNTNNNAESSNPSSSRLKLVTTIQRDDVVYSMCWLRDGRLVLGGKEGIVIYREYSFKPVIFFDDKYIYSLCGLRNGNLVSGDCDGEIRIYEIEGNKHKLIHTLREQYYVVNKVIELEDGRLCSCSWDETIIIWNQNYQPIITLTGHTDSIMSIIEIYYYIISCTRNSTIIWNKYTYECITVIQHLYCCENNSLSKLGENRVILGGRNELFVLDILLFQCKCYYDYNLGNVQSILVLGEDQILLGNGEGKIRCYDLLSNQTIFIQSIYRGTVCCILETEDKKILTSSNSTIKIYEY